MEGPRSCNPSSALTLSLPHDLDRTALVVWAVQALDSSPIHLSRQLAIQRLVSVGPFGPPREPSDCDPTLPISFDRSRSCEIRRRPRHLLPLALARVRAVPWTEQVGERSVGSPPRRRSTAPSAAHLLHVVHRPRRSSLTCSRRPRCSHDSPRNPRLPCCCSPPSRLLKLGVILLCLPLAFPQH